MLGRVERVPCVGKLYLAAYSWRRCLDGVAQVAMCGLRGVEEEVEWLTLSAEWHR